MTIRILAPTLGTVEDHPILLRMAKAARARLYEKKLLKKGVKNVGVQDPMHTTMQW